MMTQQRNPKQATLVSSQQANIDWQQVCRVIWKNSLSINPLTTQPKEVEAEWEDIQLSLGLVEPNKYKYRRGYSISETEEQPSNFYSQEIIYKYSQKEFIEQVIQAQKSKTAYRKLAIIGESNTGKTTILHQIASWILDNTTDLPIWISIAEIGATPLREYLQEKWLQKIVKPQDQLIEEWQKTIEELLNSGRVWLLLDGAEQMPLEQVQNLPVTMSAIETRQPLLNPLSAITQQLQGWTDKTRLILTSRSDVWTIDKNILSNFDIFRPLELTYPAQVKQFINHWFSDNSPSQTKGHTSKELAHSPQQSVVQAEPIFQAIEQLGVSQLQELVQSPLKVALLCRIAQQNNGTLPTTKAKLYQQLIAEYYQWQAEKITLNPQQQELLNKILGKLALKAMQKERYQSWLYHHQVTQEVGENNNLLKIILRLGWLRGIGLTANEHKEPVYGFWDESFQAYLAATAIDDWHFFFNHPLGNSSSLASTLSESSYRIFNTSWRRVILLWLGREDVKKEEKDEFLQSLIEFSDGCGTDNFYGKQAYFLAASGLAEFPESQKTNEILLELLQWSFFDTQVSPLISQAAKTALIETNRQSAIEALIQLLTTIKNETIKREIFKSIEKIGQGNPQSITTLTEMLNYNSLDALHWQIAESLGKIDPGNPKAITTLIHGLETANNDETRQIIFNSLDKIAIGNFKAITTLIKLLQTTDSLTTQRRAFESMEVIGCGNATAIAALVQLIRTNSDEAIRRQAAESLEKIDPGNPTAITVLVQLIYSASDEEIRKQAVYSIGEITSNNPEAISALVKMLSPNNDIFLRWIALSSLGKIGLGNQQAIEQLIKLICSDEQGLLRKDAIETLGKIDPGNPEVIAALVELIEATNDESIRREAAESLGKIDPGNSKAIAALAKLLRTTTDEFTRREAASSLSKIEPGNLEALKTLIQLVQSTSNPDVRSLVAESLGEVGANNPAIIAVLIRLTKTTNDPKTLRRAAVSLGKVGGRHREVISALIEMVKSAEDESSRLQAADSLINLLKPEQMTEVIANLRDNLSDPIKRRDLACQNIIWYCAQQLSYPDFYQAWHNRPLYGTQKSVKTEQKILEYSSRHISKPVWENLAQLLKTNIDEHSQLKEKVRLVFIDSNDLIEPENPLIDIYDLMLAQNCPEFEHGIPDTMAKLRLYWNTIGRNNDNICYVLVFYENLTVADSPGFSPVFLKSLSKFPGAICLVTEQPSSKLKQFNPNEPELVENIISWIETQQSNH